MRMTPSTRSLAGSAMWFRLLHGERARFDCTTMQCGPGSDSPLFHWIGHACNAALQPKRSWLGHSSQLDRCSQLREPHQPVCIQRRSWALKQNCSDRNSCYRPSSLAWPSRPEADDLRTRNQ